MDTPEFSGEDASTNGTPLSVPNTPSVYRTTPETRTPHYSQDTPLFRTLFFLVQCPKVYMLFLACLYIVCVCVCLCVYINTSIGSHTNSLEKAFSLSLFTHTHTRNATVPGLRVFCGCYVRCHGSFHGYATVYSHLLYFKCVCTCV